jgi:hypothetical protein
MTPEDPMAGAEELTRRAPWDIQQGLDGLHDDPNVSDGQYVEAQAAANSATRGDATHGVRAAVGDSNQIGDDAGDEEADGWG